jgi:5'-nucleotidase
MIRTLFGVALALLATACATVPRQAASPVEVQILAFNDFHGNLQVPPPVEVTEPDGTKRSIVTGGASHLAAALAGLRAGHSRTVTVSAGDTIGASPLISANYLDEPTIDAMNALGLEFNSVGNHEFDKGVAELKRMQTGGAPSTRAGLLARSSRSPARSFAIWPPTWSSAMDRRSFQRRESSASTLRRARSPLGSSG